MNKQQMELAIRNLQDAVTALAKKTYDRDTANEMKTSTIEAITNANAEVVDDHDTMLLELQYQIVLTQICGDIDISSMDVTDDEEVTD